MLNFACSPSGVLAFSRSDTSFDTKSMVAITSADTTLSAKRIQVHVDPAHVSSAGVTAQVMCYFRGIDDDETAAP